VTQLGYLDLEVGDLEGWERFATEVLGLTVGERLEGGFTLRLDDYAARLYVRQGPADDVAALGWEVADGAALDALAERLRAAGTPVGEIDPGPMRVARRARFVDPGGVRGELYCGPERAAPFASPVVRSGFVAGEQGLGHAVVSAKDKRTTARFYAELLGFRLSDNITCEIFGYPVDIDFFHTPADAAPRRHHTLAVGGPHRKAIHHFMLEAAAFDEVGMAFDRALRAGVRIQQTLGRHPNDRMFSFYADTPSGFQFEFGWGGRLVEDAGWSPGQYDHISEWGHHHPSVYWPKKR
jgi:2,3-dihydroxybiphenyl 1,2-dioxygenase